jgi:plasmid maintenance system killer protein
VIVSYRNRQTEEFSAGHRIRAYENIERSGLMKLNKMKAFETVDDLARIPGNRLERLKGNREIQYPDQRSVAYMLQVGRCCKRFRRRRDRGLSLR